MEVFNSEEQCKTYINNFPREANFENDKIMIFPPVTDIESLRANLINAEASDDVMKCVEFVFRRYRSGIYVAYINGLLYFIIFINLETPNEYVEYLEIDPSLERRLPKMVGDINKFLASVNSDTTYIIKEDKNEWNVSGFLVKLEDYISKNPQFVTHFIYEIYVFLLAVLSDNTFVEFMNNKRLDFIINYKDQNLLRIDNTDPLFHIVNPPRMTNNVFNQPFLSEDFIKICPILSFCGHVDYLDIPIPTPDDIARVMKIYVPDLCKPRYQELWSGEETPLPDWNQRKSIAVFRGSSTGWGLNIKTNPRLKIANLSIRNSHLLDAGISRFAQRFKKVYNERYIKINDTRGLKKSNYLSYVEQANYKYQVYIEGNVAAFRLGAMFGSGSLVLKVKSDYRLWFEPLLQENKHYIAVNSDLSNLLDVISWCQNNDNICKQIATNGKNFYNAFLGDKIYDYTRAILKKLAKPVV
jgi:hypothetical protein